MGFGLRFLGGWDAGLRFSGVGISGGTMRQRGWWGTQGSPAFSPFRVSGLMAPGVDSRGEKGELFDRWAGGVSVLGFRVSGLSGVFPAQRWGSSGGNHEAQRLVWFRVKGGWATIRHRGEKGGTMRQSGWWGTQGSPAFSPGKVSGFVASVVRCAAQGGVEGETMRH